jgi:FkbM family methyltransferase
MRGVTGIDICRYDAKQSPPARIVTLCSAHAIDTVLDVGANVGDYAKELFEAGFRGRVLSFEPLGAAHAILQRRAARVERWDAAPRMAVGDRDDRVKIHVANNLTSSSLREMLPAHLRAAPESRYVGSEVVPLQRLDGVSHPFIADASCLFLKSDTQGFEEQVMKGAQGLMHKVRGVQLEMSLVSLYEGQSLFSGLYHDLESQGFELYCVLPGFTDRATGRMLQMDCVFFRR